MPTARKQDSEQFGFRYESALLVWRRPFCSSPSQPLPLGWYPTVLGGTAGYRGQRTPNRLLAACTDDYATRIWSRIEDTVVADVLQCTDDCEDGFTECDVSLAIGRAIAEQFGFEV